MDALFPFKAFASSRYALLLLFVSLFHLSTALSYAKPKIGIITPLSGAYASFGDQIQAGMNLAANGEVELIFEDSRFDIKSALSAYRKLTSIDKIDMLISAGGETCGVLNREAQRDKLLHIAVGCNTEKFELPESYSFRLDVNEAEAAAKLAEYLTKQSVKKLAILNIENTWGTTVAKFASAAFSESGIGITDHLTFLPNDAGNLRTLLSKVAHGKPDRLFMVSSPETFALVLKQLDELNIQTPVVSTISVENPQFMKLGGALTNGIVYLAVRENPKSKVEHPEFYKRFPKNNTFTAWGYDSVLLLRNAMKQRDPKGYMQTLHNFVGAYGAYNYDCSGDLHLEYEMRTISNGEYRALEKVD